MRPAPATPLAPLEVVVEVPRGGFVKRADDGRVDFVSPVPCPFNYGSVPRTRAEDGERLDALVLGPRLPRGSLVRDRAVGVVHFLDAGVSDPKVVCAASPPTERQWRAIARFFRLYALAKRGLYRLRGEAGETRFEGIERWKPLGEGPTVG